ncbi:hypothetical protein TEK04_19590 [Klenkia sp. LSe6-5]|uniref:Phage tail protein n=1 Tax=Klenkia sesuvii TaxID=3103137 RepID=A0ABU8DZ01_9ACTN
MTAPEQVALELVGADGSVWSLTTRGAPAQLLGGITGLFNADGETRWTTRDVGRRRRGRIVQGRSVSFQVLLGDNLHPSSAPWRAVNAAWWAALGGGDDPFTLRLTLPETDSLGRPDVRTLQLWDTSTDPGTSAVFSPYAGRAVFPVTAEAESAFWSGPEVTASFVYNPAADVDYYGGPDGLGPPFYIGGGSQFDNATISNPGQTPAWLRWAITAPFSSASVGVGGDLIPLPFAQVLSQRVVIETDPRRRSITDGAGNNLWPLIGPGLEPLFAPVPSGMSVPLSIVLDNPAAGSRVDVALPPEYRRAWG